jgi:hypothetical protein
VPHPIAPDDPPPTACPLPGLAAAAPATPPSDTVAAHDAKADRRPADTIWRRNPREQGLLGLVDAIAYFGELGWPVAVPLIDAQPYDLVVDDGARLQRVQVKTTTCRGPSGRFIVQLCTRGGNRSFHTTKAFDPSACDLLFVLTDDRNRYLIPTTSIITRTSLTLDDRFAGNRV